MNEPIEDILEARQRQGHYRAGASMAGFTNAVDEAAAKKVVKEMAHLILSDSGLRVHVRGAAPKDEAGTPVGSSGAPSIDEPGSRANREAITDSLFFFLQLDGFNGQMKGAQARIKASLGELKKRQTEMGSKIERNLNAMNEAFSQSQTSRTLGWLGVGVACIVAIAAVAATIATAGAAAPGAAAAVTGAAKAGVAVGAGAAGAAGAGAGAGAGALTAGAIVKASCAVASAVIAITAQAMNETGAMEKLNDALAESLFKDMGKNQANAAAQVFTGVLFTVATLITGAVSASAVASAVKMGGVFAKVAMHGLNLGMTIGSLVAQGQGIKANYDAGSSESEKTALTAELKRLQQVLQEVEKELEELVANEQEALSKMADVIDSKMKAEKEIAGNMGNMA